MALIFPSIPSAKALSISSNNPTPAILLFPPKRLPQFLRSALHLHSSRFVHINLIDLYIHHGASPLSRLIFYPPPIPRCADQTTIQPHADSSYFSTSQEPTKAEVYAQVLEQAKGLVTGQRNWVSISSPPVPFLHITNTPTGQVITILPANPTKHTRPWFSNKNSNFSNIASLLWHAYAALPSPSSSVNWAGFYIRQDKFPSLGSQNTPSDNNNNILLLGPFQGRPACQEIRFGRGVCGSAAEKRETVIVPDVLSFPGHIACDASSRSEIVVPILVGGEVSLISLVEGVLCCVVLRC